MGGIGHVLTKAYGYARRGLNVYAPTVFGNGTETMSKAYQKAMTTKNPFKGQFYKDLWTGTKQAGKTAEELAAKQKGKFWQNSWSMIKGLPKKVAQGWKVGAYKAAKSGKNKFFGGLKGSLSAFGKRMPLIGSLLLVAFELPNIIKATANEGIIQGGAEVVKTGARLAGGTLGAAIGQTLIPIPFVGGLVGWLAGEALTGKIVGKSYSEKEAEKAQEITQNQGTLIEGAETTAQTNPIGNSDYFKQMMMYQQMMSGDKFDDDIMAKAYLNSLEKQLDVKA